MRADDATTVRRPPSPVAQVPSPAVIPTYPRSDGKALVVAANKSAVVVEGVGSYAIAGEMIPVGGPVTRSVVRFVDKVG